MNDTRTEAAPTSPSARRVALAGATGLVGHALLQGLLRDPGVAQVHALVRRPLTLEHSKLLCHTVDFAALPALPALDEVYLALGTTIKAAGSQAAFRAVDFDANLAVARAAHDAGASRVGLVSAMGANAHSRIFYSRIKGELEEALAAQGFAGLVIAQPSLLVGDRHALGQPSRAGETIATYAGKWLRPVLPANLRPIQATAVAGALLARVPGARGLEVLASADMQGFA